MKSDKDQSQSDLTLGEDYYFFCDSKQYQTKSSNKSTENNTENLLKKREREREREKKEEEVEEKEGGILNKKKEKKSIEVTNENILLYSDDENEKEIKEESSCSNEDECEYFDDFNKINGELEGNNDEKFVEFFGDVACNDN